MSDVKHPWPFSAGFEFKSAVGAFNDKVRDQLKKMFVAHKQGLRDGSRSVIEVKLDGWRSLIVKNPKTGKVECYRRGIAAGTGTYYDLLQDGPIPDVEVLADRMEPGDAVEAELVWEGHRAAEVPTALKSHRHALTAIGFAWPFHDESPLATWTKQHDLLVERQIKRPIIYGGGAHLLAPEALADAATARKIEGFMVKACDTDEQLWWKVKREALVDAIVVDTKDSQGYIRGIDGMVGALVVGVICEDHDNIEHHKCWLIDFEDGKDPVHVREIANVAGLNDSEREDMTKRRDDLVGKVCEIRCQASGGLFGGRMRHPRFVRWRDDKGPRECTGKDIYGE